MSLLSVSGLSFRYPSTPELFRDATFAIDAGDCLAVVGANGAGKSTLLGILAGEVEPGGGTIARRKGLRIAAADQQGAAGAGSLFDYVFGARPHLAHLRIRLAATEREAPCEYSELVNEYGACGGYAAEAETERILDGLGFAPGEWTCRRRACRADSGRGPASRAHCTPRPTCCCWTSRPTTSTSRPANGSKISSPGARAYWCRTTAIL
jgi:ATPase subunit of ABC transporter with duplicated ATPase domains